MSKREKIILIIMALTVVYGFYALFLETSTSPINISSSESKLDAFNKFINNVAAMTKDGLSDIDSYIIEHIPAKWTKDPLLKTKNEFKFDEAGRVAEEASAQKLGITYSGFLQMDNKSLAIINGMEYETGERLRQSGYVVGAIYPTRVIILTRGGKQRISIQLRDTQ